MQQYSRMALFLYLTAKDSSVIQKEEGSIASKDVFTARHHQFIAFSLMKASHIHFESCWDCATFAADGLHKGRISAFTASEDAIDVVLDCITVVY